MMSTMKDIDWTDAQIDALLELDGRGQRRGPAEVLVDERPRVERECLCPNNHEPGADGFIVTAPSCAFHGFEARILAARPVTIDSEPVMRPERDRPSGPRKK